VTTPSSRAPCSPDRLGLACLALNHAAAALPLRVLVYLAPLERPTGAGAGDNGALRCRCAALHANSLQPAPMHAAQLP